MNKKLQKKSLLVNTKEPMVIRHPKNDKHGDVTVVVLNLAIPLKPLTHCIIPGVLEAVQKVSNGYPMTDLRFNYKPEAPAFLFTVKAKTECRGEDVPNQEIGDMVAMAKAQAKAAAIGCKVAKAIKSALMVEVERVTEVGDYFSIFAAQEMEYVKKEKYLTVLAKRQSKAEK